MSLPYFYEPGAALTAACTPSEETSKHCVQVLRMKRGEQLHLTDGRGHLFTATIIEADKKAAVARIEDAVYTAPPSRRASIAISLLKTGKTEVIAGINLPMLIRLAGARKSMELPAAVAAARDAGRNYITIASEFLGQDA